MTTAWRFSASQISTYEDCPRKWGWRYINKLYADPHPSAQFGTEVHGHLEQWFKQRQVPPEDPAGKLAQVMIPYLPAPQLVDPAYVEREFRVTLGGYSFKGYVDLVLPERKDKPPLINDHKTTGDLKWALSHDDLPGDVQGSLYAYWGFVHTKADEILLQWLYGRTKGSPLVLPVQRVVQKHEIEERLEKTIQSAEEIALVINSGIKTAADLPYDASACDKYGGCPYQEKCGLNAQERMESIMAQGEKADFLKRLRSKREEQAKEAVPTDEAQAAPAKAEEKVEKSTETKAEKKESPLAKLKNRGKSQQQKQDVNPPEQHKEPPPPAPAEAAEAAEKTTPSKRSAKTSKKKAEKVEEKKTETKKAETKKTETKPKNGAAASSTEGWTLYVNCYPLRLPEDVPAPVGAEDYAYSGQEPRSPDEIRAQLRENPPTMGVIFSGIMSNPNEQRRLLAFMSEATTVIQG